MTSDLVRKYVGGVAVLCTAVVVPLGTVAVPGQGHADGGCVPGDAAGQVPRNARPGDNVCVTPATAAIVAKENAAPTANRDPNGAASQTCTAGFVWREAFVGDAICVTTQRRSESWAENEAAGVGPTGEPRSTSVAAVPPKATPGAAPPKSPTDNDPNEPPYQRVCQKWRGVTNEIILVEDSGYNIFAYSTFTGQASFDDGKGGPVVWGDITSHDLPDGTDDRNIGFHVHWNNGWTSSYPGEIEADGSAQGTYQNYGPKGEVSSGHWKAIGTFVCDQ
jgi:hypothetical protein